MTHSKKIWIARFIAVAVDIVQIAVAPAVMEGIVSPLDAILDIATAAIMIALLGWNVAFVPTFIVKALPFADLAPTWTIAVLIVTRKGATASDPAAITPATLPPRLPD